MTTADLRLIPPQPDLTVESAPPPFLDGLVARVTHDYEITAEEVRRIAAEISQAFAGARVRAFVPVLVEKRLRDHLRAGRVRPRAEASTRAEG